MKIGGHKLKLKGNSALAIAAGCAVAFMFIATIISVALYRQRMHEAAELLQEAKYRQYDSYVVMISSDDQADFWQEVYRSAQAYGKEHGIYVDLLSDNVDVTYSKNELFEMAIDSGCDAILLEGDDSKETADLLDKARKAQIPVITMQSDVNADSRISFVGVNNYSISNLYAASLAEVEDRKKDVMVVSSSANTLNATMIANNIQEKLTEQNIPGGPVNFDVRLIENKDAFATEEYIQNLFKENDLAPIVICLDEESTADFYQATIDYNKVGQINIYGNYQSQTILTGIKQGVIKSTVTMDASSIGKAAAQAFAEYKDSGYVSDYINVDAFNIDKSNVEEFLQEVSDEKN